jgi:hypothetical protein
MGLRIHGPLVGAAVIAAACCANACASESSTGFDGDGGSSGGSGGSSGGSSGGGSTGGSSSGSKGSSTGGNGSSSSGGTSSSSGGGSGSTSSSGSSSGGSSSGGDAGCTANIANGAIPLTANYLSGSVIGDGGYAYAYDDKMGSVACLDSTAYCGAGTTAVATANGTVWGAGIGASLNQAMAMNMQSPPIDPYAVTGSGVSYQLDNFPSQGMRLIIDQMGVDYCAPLSAASGTIKWASFNTKCWDGSGTTLAGAPQIATHLQFQVTANAAITPFSFCVTGVSFAP